MFEIQNSKLSDFSLGHSVIVNWDLFGIWNLGFGI